VPTPALSTAFDNFAEPLLWQAQNLRLQNQKLRAARDLLLPRLMSGELAV
jgi:type I restriction enzyme, S subunit